MNGNFIHRPNCGLCGSENKTILFSKEFTGQGVLGLLESYYESRINKEDLAGGRYEVAKCAHCGFIWQTDILNDDLMKKLYGGWISPEKSLQKRSDADISLFYGYAREIQNAISLLSVRPSEINALDFGMGWGRWCLVAKAFGCNAYGFEISKDRVEFARKNGINVIENFFDIAPGQFNFINAEQVFEHIPDPLRTLKSISQSLREGGIVRIAVPNGESVPRESIGPEYKIMRSPIHPLEHINCFTRQSLIVLGKTAGLTPVKEPLLMASGYNLKSCLRGALGGYYRRYFGTSIYFKKSAKII